MASARLRSSRERDETSPAWPLATMPVTPGAAASQRRCFRYAGSSISRSALKGNRLAGMHPEKTSSLIGPTSVSRTFPKHHHVRSARLRLHLAKQLLVSSREFLDHGRRGRHPPVGAADDVER